MNTLLWKTAYLTSVGLVIGQSSLLAEDNFILQPKIQPVITAVREASPTADRAPVDSQNLVFQPSKSGGPLPTAKPQFGSPPELVQYPAVQSQATIAQQSVTLPPDPVRDPDGLTWFKRGSLSASVRAVVAKRPEPSQAAPMTNTIDIASPATTKAPPASTLVDTTNFNTDALVKKEPVPATSTQWQNTRQPAITTVSAANNRTRAQMASKISKKILGESPPQKYLSPTGSSLMGPGAVERGLSEALARSEQLCRRGVFLSAREEAKSAQLQLARYLDSISNSFQSEPHLRAAQVALREASDFSRPSAHKILQELITAHDTPALKDVDVSQAPPASLKQSYYQYAERSLLEGAQQHPWFSDIFYTLGRTYQAEADSNVGDECEYLRAQAVVYYRAASMIRPTNALATNQLGYVLLQLDRPAEAMTSLIASVDSKLDTPALQNLAEASRRVGDEPMQRWALGQIAAINSQTPQTQRRSPNVIELDNSAFNATTPIVPFSTSSDSRAASLPSGNLR